MSAKAFVRSICRAYVERFEPAELPILEMLYLEMVDVEIKWEDMGPIEDGFSPIEVLENIISPVGLGIVRAFPYDLGRRAGRQKKADAMDLKPIHPRQDMTRWRT